jgi:hypothetical protein
MKRNTLINDVIVDVLPSDVWVGILENVVSYRLSLGEGLFY